MTGWKTRLPTQRAVILIGSIGLFLFSVSRILQSDASVLPQAGAAAKVEARTSAAEPATRLVAIEQLQVGQRVRADAPTDELDLQFGTEVVSEDWRKLTLLAPKRDGSTADVVLLRPLTWLNNQQAEVGGTVFISVPECGIDGHAQVLAIETCPEILPGDGRVITGTFRHQVSASISLTTAGQQEPILCTGNHPFWSEDRQDFVRADSLQPNETLRTTSGSTTVTSLTHIPGSTAVYNLEIHGTHVYHVGTSGVLVHNGDPENCIWTWEQLLANGRFRTLIDEGGSKLLEVTTASGTKLEVMFNEVWDGTRLILSKAHIQGAKPGAIGYAQLSELAKAYGKLRGASEIAIEGFQRATGAMKGKTQRPWIFKLE